MIGAISSALTGLMAASKKADASAASIATGSAGGNRTVEDLVTLKTAEIEFKANLASIRIANEMADEAGRLFDKRV